MAGLVKSIPAECLSILSQTHEITLTTESHPPSHLCRKSALTREYKQILENQYLPINVDIDDSKHNHLRYRKSPIRTATAVTDEFSLINVWHQELEHKAQLQNLMDYPNAWSTLNRIRNKQGRLTYSLHKWSKKPAPFWKHDEIQTVKHITEAYPINSSTLANDKGDKDEWSIIVSSMHSNICLLE